MLSAFLLGESSSFPTFPPIPPCPKYSFHSSPPSIYLSFFRYIGVFGTPENEKNSTTEAVAMTAPVVSESVAMTAPVVSESVAMTAPVVSESVAMTAPVVNDQG